MKEVRTERVTAESFRPFGKVFQRPTDGPLVETDAVSFWSDLAHFEINGETEVGWCVVRAHDSPIDWFERHTQTPELLIPVDAPMILPVMDSESNIAAFRVEVGEAVIIARDVWHSACLPADGHPSSSYFVIFRRGTPANDVAKTTVGDFRIVPATSSADSPS